MNKAPPKNARTMSQAEFRKALINVAFTDAARMARAAENERLAIIAKKYGKPQNGEK